MIETGCSAFMMVSSHASFLAKLAEIDTIKVLQQLKGVGMMLRWALIFLVVALVAGLLGFTGIAGTAVGIARILFFVFILLFVLSLLFGSRRRIR